MSDVKPSVVGSDGIMREASPSSDTLQTGKITIVGASNSIRFPDILNTPDDLDAFNIPTLDEDIGDGNLPDTPTDAGRGYVVYDPYRFYWYFWNGSTWDTFDLSKLAPSGGGGGPVFVTGANVLFQDHLTCAVDLAQGDAIFINGSGHIDKADSISNHDVVGFNVAGPRTAGATDCGVCFAGATPSIFSVFSGLAIGAKYYLSSTSGQITATPPDPFLQTEKQVYVGTAIAADSLIVDIDVQNVASALFSKVAQVNLSGKYTCDDDVTTGAAVYLKSNGHVALADSVDHPDVIGLCASDQSATEGVLLFQFGLVSLGSDVYSGGPFSGLTQGSKYYLSDTPGEITTTKPSGFGNSIVEVGTAVGSTVLFVSIQKPETADSETIVSASGTYTVLLSDRTILGDATLGSQTFALPAISDATGMKLTVIKTDSSINTITIDGDGSEAINGSTTKVLIAQFDTVTLLCTSAGWFIE